MIVIDDKHNCCGCGACAQVCPHSCITMKRDEEGFLYPETDALTCNGCGLCERTCPISHPSESKQPLNSYYSYSLIEEIRRQGSSGGMFRTIAENVISSGGIVFGARFDEKWDVVHGCTGHSDGLAAFCGSKYLQSRIGDSFRLAKEYLDHSRTVLFCGTPCQIHGLKQYLKKEYSNLITIDSVCHGVPSPMIWQSYLDYTAVKNGFAKDRITYVSFRDKSTGWKRYSLTINGNQDTSVSVPFVKDSYMQLFLHDYTLRPSCYNCRFKNGNNSSDITLGDFWGVSDILPKADDDKGLSIILANTDKGQELVSGLRSARISPLPLQDCLHRNPSYFHSAKEPVDRYLFWKSFYEKGYMGALSFLKSVQPSSFSLMKYRIKTFFRSLKH